MRAKSASGTLIVQPPCINYTCGPARFLLAQSMRRLSTHRFFKAMMLRNFFMLAACASPMAAGIACADTSPIPAADYKVAKSWRLGGNGGGGLPPFGKNFRPLVVARSGRGGVAGKLHAEPGPRESPPP